MKMIYGLALIFAIFLSACQPAAPPSVTLLDNGQVTTLQTEERVPSSLLAQAGISLNPNDRILVNGSPVALNQPITGYSITIQIRRATTLSLVTPDGEQKIQSSAFTIGEALAEASIWLREGDLIEPPLDTPITNTPITIYYSPARELTLTSNGKTTTINSSALTVGEALTEAGMPLLGMDYSIPAEKEPIPSNGRIKVVHVSESVLLAQKPIPFESDFQASAEVPLDQTQIIQPGETGLAVQRIRIRYEDGNEISRLTEDETMVRPPRTRILGYGTKAEVRTAVVDGVEIEYWRAVQMYATSYSPCRSGADRCYPGTSSGKSLRKGMVAMRYDWYLSMGGQPLFIPGYGYATIEDVCGGCTDRPWIDLGYSDNDWQQWSSWVTVYFLTPVPPNIIYVLE
jgi:resuscitation-promoting factor RpfB